MNAAAITDQGKAYADRIQSWTLDAVMDALMHMAVQQRNSYGEDSEQVAILRGEIARRVG